jgi:hypothetical protein
VGNQRMNDPRLPYRTIRTASVQGCSPISPGAVDDARPDGGGYRLLLSRKRVRVSARPPRVMKVVEEVDRVILTRARVGEPADGECAVPGTGSVARREGTDSDDGIGRSPDRNLRPRVVTHRPNDLRAARKHVLDLIPEPRRGGGELRVGGRQVAVEVPATRPLLGVPPVGRRDANAYRGACGRRRSDVRRLAVAGDVAACNA